MSIFLCTENGDFAIVNNQFWLTDNSVSTVPAVAAAYPNPGQETLQLIRDNLRMGQGEEDLDPTLGIPWLQQIFEKGTSQDTIQSILYNAILNTPGVTGMVSFSLTVNPVTRVATVDFVAQTQSGPVTSSETFP